MKKSVIKSVSIIVLSICVLGGYAQVGNTPEFVPVSDSNWKKNEDGSSYWLMIKGVSVADKCKSYFLQDDLLVYYPVNNQLYLLNNFKIKEPEVYHNAELLALDITNGFWYKNSKGGAAVFAPNGDLFKESEIYEYTPNGIDVYYKAINQTERVVLKNFKNSSQYQVFSCYKYQTYLAETDLGDCFKGNCYEGYGEIKYSDGKIVEGFFEKGKPNGPAHFIDTDGNESFTTYVSNYDTTKGLVYIYFKNGNYEFHDMDRQLSFFLDNSRLYNYNYSSKTKSELYANPNSKCDVGNCSNGVGSYLYDNGARYTGAFKNGLRHGFGQINFTNGDYYIGEFVNDKKQGLGTYVWSEFMYYMGEYLNDQYSGKGVMYYSKDNYQAGLWQSGKFVKSLDGNR